MNQHPSRRVVEGSVSPSAEVVKVAMRGVQSRRQCVKVTTGGVLMGREVIKVTLRGLLLRKKVVKVTPRGLLLSKQVSRVPARCLLACSKVVKVTRGSFIPDEKAHPKSIYAVFAGRFASNLNKLLSRFPTGGCIL